MQDGPNVNDTCVAIILTEAESGDTDNDGGHRHRRKIRNV